MDRIAHWLVYGALITAIAVLWNFNKASADTVAYTVAGSGDTETKTTIIDNSSYPDIVAVLQCSGSDINDMINACGAALRELCPGGGTIKEARGSAEGVLPARVELVVACRHEATGA